VRVKPRIAKRDGEWVVTRPLIGFRPTPDETKHESWRDAVGSMVDLSQHYVAGGSAERAGGATDQIAAVPRWTALDY
jgi:hypothetical protein